MFPPLRRISPQLAGPSRAARNFLTVHGGLIVCVLFLLAGLFMVSDYGAGVDESVQRRFTRANLDYILGRAASVETIISHDRVYGVAFELPLLLVERVLGLEDYHYVHRLRLSITHLFFIVGAFFCYLLAYRLFGSRPIALLTLLIFLLHPRIYGHSFFNSKDPIFLSVFVIALYLLERAFRRDTIGAFVLLGLAVGLLTNLRIMGAILFPAVIAMRGLDFFYAGNWPERRDILRTAGLFLLAGGLTMYALSPYAWTNPVGYLTTNLVLTVHHPAVNPQLFQGVVLPPSALPPHYSAVWFGITTPLLSLLLGFIGMAMVVVAALRRPGAALRNGRRRFLLLLLAAFLLPPLAAALLGSTQYDDWRHFYFLYAPFCLLAAGGLHWLAAARARRWPGPAGAYALTAAGLGLVLLQLMQLHPLQHYYFNSLVDRTSPGQLQSRYHFSFPELAHWATLQRMLKRHPGETLVARLERRQDRERDWPLLAPADRERLLLAPSPGRNADYELIYDAVPSRPDLAFNGMYRRFYNETFYGLQPLKSSRMTPAAIAAYRELYRQASAAEPVLRADYAVYRNGRRLTFVKENCPPQEPDFQFTGKIFRHQLETLPPPLENRNFTALYFYNRRVQLGTVCLAVIQLPDYAQGDLILTQHLLNKSGPTGEPRWEGIYSLSRPGLRELIAQERQGRQRPPGPEDFAVFRDRRAGRHRLLYAKEKCSLAEYETPVFLHIRPENRADLPFYLWKDGIDNRDFALDFYGGRPGGECVASVPLPEYPIAALRTGQTERWEVNLYPLADPGDWSAAYAALSGRQPAARSAFALYLRDNQLTYLRESCSDADTAAGFFLHIVPVDVSVLPAERQAAGFANLDFAFGRWGGSFDGKCLATVPLPDYPVKSLRTGQYVPGQGEVWAAELMVER